MLRVILAFWGSYFCKKNPSFFRWVMLVEKRICDVDGKLIIYHENLKRLRKRLEVLKQIHDAPNIYAFLVVEVVRRRKFSSTFTEVGNYFFLSGSITELLNEAVCVINIL
jgi:hypothetical protein